MGIKTRTLPFVTKALTSEMTRGAQRWLFESVRRARGAPRTVHYYHQVDDPYSHLVAQTLSDLVARYDIELVPHLVGPPPDDAAPDRARLEAWARRDAVDLTSFVGLDFVEGVPEKPASAQIQLAQRLAVAVIERGDFSERIVAIGDALWGEDPGALSDMAERGPCASEAEATEHLLRSDTHRARSGHYLSATFAFGGRWYWGIDRLAWLEEELDATGARRPEITDKKPLINIETTPAWEGKHSGEPLEVEFYYSLRSPYSYIAMARTFDLEARYPVRLVPRPVLPMVMRGMKVPFIKQVYIVLDTRREADRHGVPFGRIADPVGVGVERGLALIFHTIRAGGPWQALSLSLCQGAMAEGIDMATDEGLRQLAERAGLSWADATAALADDRWREEATHNRDVMIAEMDLWGVPCYRVGAESFWGQDRIWRVEEAIKTVLNERGDKA